MVRRAAVAQSAEIDVIIANHIEPDHSGALPELLKLCPKAKIYGSARAGQGLERGGIGGARLPDDLQLTAEQKAAIVALHEAFTAAHADEIALTVNYINKEGFIYVRKLGGVDAAITKAQRVLIHTPQGSVRGVVGNVYKGRVTRVLPGAVSTEVRTLARMGLVHRSSKIADRKDYYELDEDIWKIIIHFVRERKKRELEPVLDTMRRSS